MQTRVLALAGLLTAALLTPAPTAQASGEVSVRVRGCEVTFTNISGGEALLEFEQGQYHLTATGPERVYRFTAPAGSYNWRSYPAVTGDGGSGGELILPAACGVKSARQGDHNGDGKADVVGIQAGTGDLYYYRTVGGRLSPGVKVGRGWNRMVHIHQTAGHFAGPEGVRKPSLIAIRDDGAVFSYPQLGSGRHGKPTQIATAPVGASAYAVLEPDHVESRYAVGIRAVKGGQMIGIETGWYTYADIWPVGSSTDAVRLVSVNALPLGETFTEGSPWYDYDATLMAIKPDGTLVHYVNDRETGFTVTGTVGRGWKPMQVVTSPGSLDGDRISDIIGRRSDGNLYSYRGLQNGRLGPAVRIGKNWQKMRLLA